MIKKLVILIFGLAIQHLLTSCSPVKLPVTHQYKLDSYSEKRFFRHNNIPQASKLTGSSIVITQPEAHAGYHTNQMLYVKKPFELSAFAHNAWIAPPADMLYPLIIQSVQHSGYFYAVSSGSNSEPTDYRLDTQLIKLQQNFLKIPSTIEMVVKVTLTEVHNNRLIASRIISEHKPCSVENPYSGVIAANLVTKQFTEELSQFIVTEISRDKKNRAL